MKVDEIHIFTVKNRVYEILVHYVKDGGKIPSLPQSITREGRVLPVSAIESVVLGIAGVKTVVWLDPDDCRRLFVITSEPWDVIDDKLSALQKETGIGATALKAVSGH